MFTNDRKDCCFCGHEMVGREDCNKRDLCEGHREGEFKKCKEEERCFEKTFECREKRIIECRQKDCREKECHNKC